MFPSDGDVVGGITAHNIQKDGLTYTFTAVGVVPVHPFIGVDTSGTATTIELVTVFVRLSGWTDQVAGVQVNGKWPIQEEPGSAVHQVFLRYL
jgi:hypothetical protein